MKKLPLTIPVGSFPGRTLIGLVQMRTTIDPLQQFLFLFLSPKATVTEKTTRVFPLLYFPSFRG